MVLNHKTGLVQIISRLSSGESQRLQSLAISYENNQSGCFFIVSAAELGLLNIHVKQLLHRDVNHILHISNILEW